MTPTADLASQAAGVAAEQAEPPLVLTLDVGTSSLRAMLFDVQGRAVRGALVHVPYQIHTTADGGAAASASAMLRRAVRAIDRLLGAAGSLAGHIGAVAVDTFWHSLLGVDATGEALTPVYTWADTRAASAALELKTLLDEGAVHARTGCVFHSTYPPAKLRWLAQTQPEVFGRVTRWMTFGEYLYLRLFGRTAASFSIASGSGLFDQHRCCWDEEMLQAVGLTADRLAPLVDRHSAQHGLLARYARRWPALAAIPWFPAVADGPANNVGSGCFSANRIVVMVGTSGAMRVVWPTDDVCIPRGLWVYRLDRRHFVMGGVLSSGGNMVAWMRDTLRLGKLGEAEEEVAAMAPDAHGLTILPFLAGERSTGWAAHAHASFVGMTLHTRPIELLRAGMEAVALRFADIYALLRRELPAVPAAGGRRSDAERSIEVIASGGALVHSPVWQGIIADALGCPVVASTEAEATSRGTALLALEALGVLPNLGAAPASLGRTAEPSPSHHAIYQEALERQKRLYRVLIADGARWHTAAPE